VSGGHFELEDTIKCYIYHQIPLNKIKILLDANSELLAEVGDFIKQSTMMDMLLLRFFTI
jgi:hypothetical protein